MIQIIWEFHVAADKRADFERHYAADGTWAKFFKRDEAYQGTQLLHDTSDPSRYITIDLWDDEDSYGSFRTMHHKEYADLDRDMESLTESEKRVGVFHGKSFNAAR